MKHIKIGPGGLGRIKISGFGHSGVKKMKVFKIGPGGLGIIKISNFGLSGVKKMKNVKIGPGGLGIIKISRFGHSGMKNVKIGLGGLGIIKISKYLPPWLFWGRRATLIPILSSCYTSLSLHIFYGVLHSDILHLHGCLKSTFALHIA